MSRESRVRILCALFGLSLVALPMRLVTPAAVGQAESTTANWDDLFGDTAKDDSSTAAGAGDGTGTPETGPDQQQADAEAQRQQALALFREAKALADQEKYAQAIEKYFLLSRAAPEFSVPALVERGRCFIELEEPGQAVESFAAAQSNLQPYTGMTNEDLGITIESYQITIEMCKALIDEGRMADAMEYLSMAIDQKPSSPELYFYRGLANSKQAANLPGRDRLDALQVAVASFDRAIQLKEDYAEAYFERGSAKGDLALMTGQFDEPVEDLEKARELDSENIEYIFAVGAAYLQRARQKFDPDPEEIVEIVADHHKAIEAFDQFIAKHPEPLGADSSVDGGLGPGLPFGADESKPGQEEVDDQLKLENGYIMRADARISLAKYLPDSERKPHYEAAIDDCDKALEIEPEAPFAYYNRGVAWRLLDDFERAIDDLTEVLKVAPGFTSASLRRGIIWFYRGEFQLALGDFQQAMLGRPDGRAKFWAGACYAQMGDYESAIEEYSEAVRQNPGFTLAYNNRGLAYLHRGLYDRAIEDFNELIRRDQTNAKAYYRRGLAYQGLEEPAEAEKSFQKAKQLDRSLPVPAST